VRHARHAGEAATARRELFGRIGAVLDALGIRSAEDELGHVPPDHVGLLLALAVLDLDRKGPGERAEGVLDLLRPWGRGPYQGGALVGHGSRLPARDHWRSLWMRTMICADNGTMVAIRGLERRGRGVRDGLVHDAKATGKAWTTCDEPPPLAGGCGWLRCTRSDRRFHLAHAARPDLGPKGPRSRPDPLSISTIG